MALFQSQLCSSALTSREAAGQANRFLRLEELANFQQQQQFYQQQTQSIDGGGQSSSICTQVVWMFFWFIILIIFAYPIAFCSAIFYVLFNPFKVSSCCKEIMNFLMASLDLPSTCVKNIINAKQLFQM